MGGRALLLAGLLVTVAPALGQTLQPGWIADPRTGKINGQGTIIGGNGNGYTGNWWHGVPNGHGTAVIDGRTFKGNWVMAAITRVDRW